ncbi:AAA family ATPase [Nanoarchaeota archaeon]
MISKHLIGAGFVKLKKLDKEPIDKGWTKKPINYNEANDSVKQGYNIGLNLGHKGYIGIDCDHPSLAEAVRNTLPETYEQESAGRQLPHFIYKCSWTTNITFKDAVSNKQIGQLLTWGKQIVLHPSKLGERQYKIARDIKPAEIIPEQLMQLVEQFPNTFKKQEEQLQEERKQYPSTTLDDLKITDVLNLGGFKQATNGEYYGSNPWHGSDTGKNFWINPGKNVAHCFRCDSGISPIKAFALNKGIIKDCSSSLRGSEFIETLKLARSEGLIKEDEPEQAEEQKENPIIDIFDYNQLADLKDTREYLVDKIIPNPSVSMLFGAPASFKSMVATQMALCIATKENFLNLKTRQAPVLLCDLENGLIEIRKRLTQMVKGLALEDTNMPLYITETQIDLRSPNHIAELVNIINKKKIKLVIFDTLHRFGCYDENSSNDINELYNKVFSPLKRLGISVLFLHHSNKKGGNYRGSSDFLGNVDVAFSICKHGETFTIYHEKNRFGKSDEQIHGEVRFKEDSIALEEREEPSIKEEKGKLVRDFIISILSKQPSSAKDIIDDINERHAELEASDKTIRRQLKALVDEGICKKDGYIYRLEIKEEVVS